MSKIIPLPHLAKKIHQLRGHRVLLSPDLAQLYEVQPRALVQAVKRNISRFPDDFMFQLSAAEVELLRSHLVTSSWGGVRYRPYAFTEQGVAMLSSILRTPRAIEVNIEIMRAFVRLRELILGSKDLARKLAELEKRYDEQFREVFAAIRDLMEPPVPPARRRIGFVAHEG